MITVVQLGLGALMLAYLGVFFQDVWKHRSEIHSDGPLKNFFNVAQGYITNFLDTLGIGSFAPQTIIYKTFHLVKDDSNVPGTLNVANTIPVMFEGFIFLTIVEVEAFTLIVLIIASIIGGINRQPDHADGNVTDHGTGHGDHDPGGPEDRGKAAGAGWGCDRERDLPLWSPGGSPYGLNDPGSRLSGRAYACAG